jgi:hypothetical protein
VKHANLGTEKASVRRDALRPEDLRVFTQLTAETDSPLEGNGFELVWGFSCQVDLFGLLSVLCSKRGSAFFVPSPAIRFPERAEGVKGPKRLQSLAACRLAALAFGSALTPEHAEGR